MSEKGAGWGRLSVQREEPEPPNTPPAEACCPPPRHPEAAPAQAGSEPHNRLAVPGATPVHRPLARSRRGGDPLGLQARLRGDFRASSFP